MDAKQGRNRPISEEDLERYTGKNRVEFDKWAATTTGVGGDQLAGQALTGRGGPGGGGLLGR
ncbi:hypothetical protein QBC46DRAFT_339680 [Diplogelasinospora grovesii]|uniref:Uncharacterized protein n=1 Tax=Diplogelasinospora grovesii TaxID=303347 RepID=A0AAN6NAK2_9PEZI|nr:hypothetical protein QBC46DRAFT_339680 [Diplogelasinospora grovesii]